MAAQMELRRWRETPEGRAELRRSATAFKGMPAEGAVRLLRQTFPQMAAPSWKLPELDGARLEGRRGSHSALLPKTKARAARVVDSTLPLAVRSGDGELVPLDLDLRAAAGGFRPRVPLTSFVVPRRPGDGVRFPASGLTVAPGGVAAAEPASVRRGRVVWANAGADTDVVASAMPAGVEWSWQLRSHDSPAQLALDLDVPGGARLERLPDARQGFRLVSGGDVVAHVSPPVAWDADGVRVPVSARVAGSRLRIGVDHRDAKVRYPVLVDPQVVENQQFWRTNGSLDMNGWSYSNVGWIFHSFDGGWGRGLYAFTWPGYGVQQYDSGTWSFQAPGDARVVRADFNYVVHSTPPNTWSCLSMGVAAGSSWQTVSHICDPLSYTHYSFNTGGSAGNNARFVFWIYGTNPPQGPVYTDYGGGHFGGAYTVLADDNPPYESSHGTIPAGWVRAATLTATAKDAGLGVQSIRAVAPTTHPAWAGHLMSYPCTGPRPRQCEMTPAPMSFSTDTLPEGSVGLRLDARDRAGNVRSSAVATVRVDRSLPTLSVSGVANGELLRGRQYQISGTGSDAVSGVQSVVIRFDGQQKAANTACPQGPNQNCTANWTLNAADPALAGGNHTLVVTSTDLAGNVRSDTRTVRVDRTPPSGLYLEGSLKPEDGVWVAHGAQDLYVHADDIDTGVTRAQILVDGQVAHEAPEVPCPAGGCSLDHEFAVDATSMVPGQHTLQVRVLDGGGNSTTSAPWNIKLERDPPVLALSGPLTTGTGQPLLRGQSYSLTAAATDAGPLAPPSGMGRIEFRVDEGAVQVAEQDCLAGGCSLHSEYVFVVNEWDPGPHEITVVATDLAGNESTQSFTINTQEPPPPACTPAPTPTSVTDPAGESPSTAQSSLQGALPQALQARSAVSYDELILQPALDASVQGLAKVTGGIDPVEINTAGPAPRITMHSDVQPICLTPTRVGSQASSPTAPINGTAMLFANSLPDTDTVLRPTLIGFEAVDQIRGPGAAGELSWHVARPAGQQLRVMPDGSVAIVTTVPAGSLPLPAVAQLPAPPGLQAQRNAVTDSALQWTHLSDERERLDESVPEAIVAVMTKPWARDASGQPVATSLSIEGSVVKMTVAHGSGTAYPVVAHRQVASAESVDEAQALRDDADTAAYTDAEVDDPEPPEAEADDTAGEPAPHDPATPDPDEWSGDPSALASQDTAPEGDGSAAVAEPNAAVSGAEASRLSTMTVGLTESDPAVLFSGDRLDLPSPHRIRPVVPWRVVEMLHEGEDPCVDRCALERRRAMKWARFYRLAKAPKKTNQQQSCTDSGAPRNPYGRKTSHEERCGVPTDVAIQEFDDTDRLKPPSPRRYKNALLAFLTKYKRVTRHLTAWNEPQLDKHSTRQHPKRAARFWIAAQRACHPESGPTRCKGHVIAGEFAGTRSSVTYTDGGVKRSYERTYRRYLLSQLQEHYRKTNPPRVWGFHAYEDVNRRQMLRQLVNNQATGRPLADDTPILDRYHREYTRGSLYGNAQMWVTAVGAFYHSKCPDPNRYAGFCPTNDTLLHGMRKQLEAFRFVLRRMARYDEVKAVYYYALHDVVNAGSYPEAAPYVPPGRTLTDFEGRCSTGGGPTQPCDRVDRGMVGSDTDGRYETHPDVDNKAGGARFHSASGQPRAVLCLLRHRTVSRGRCPAR